MWVRVDRSKIKPMQKCRLVTRITGALEPEMGESLQFWGEAETTEEFYEIWVSEAKERRVPRVAYLTGWQDALDAMKKQLNVTNLVPGDNFKED